MSRSREAASLVLLVSLATAGCGKSSKGAELDVTARLTLCRDSSCIAVPASGAIVTVIQGGRTVRTGDANDAGSFSVKGLAAGFYTVRVALAELGVAGESAPTDLSPGGAASIEVRLQPGLQTTFEHQ